MGQCTITTELRLATAFYNSKDAVFFEHSNNSLYEVKESPFGLEFKTAVLLDPRLRNDFQKFPLADFCPGAAISG